MNHDAIKKLSGVDRHRFEKAHYKLASDLTLDDCKVIARCAQALKDDPYLEAWTYGGEAFDLNVQAMYDDDDDKGTRPPKYVELTVFGLDNDGEADYSDIVQKWTIGCDWSGHLSAKEALQDRGQDAPEDEQKAFDLLAEYTVALRCNDGSIVVLDY